MEIVAKRFWAEIMASLSEILYAEDSAFDIFLQCNDLAICTTTSYRIVLYFFFNDGKWPTT